MVDGLKPKNLHVNGLFLCKIQKIFFLLDNIDWIISERNIVDIFNVD